MSTYTYPEDRVGNKSSNLITGEQHVLTPDNSRNFHFIVPKFAPFFADSVKVFKSINGTLLELKEGKDYHFSLEHVSASLSTGKAIYGAISFVNLNLDGTIVLQSYRTVGGQWTLSTQEMLESIANIVFNPRKLTWDQINGRPASFGPTDHTFDFNNLLTEKQIGDKLTSIRDAILAGAQNGNDHENRMDNPHNVSAIQLGLGPFYQKGLATIQEAVAGTDPDKVITASVLRSLLESLGVLDLSATVSQFKKHIAREDNPHTTISQQLNLDMVENLEVANLSDVLAKRKTRKYVTLDNMIDYIRIHGCATTDQDKRKFPVKDSLLSSYCKVRDNMGIYADGHGGTYEKIIENNSGSCGYVAPASSPQHAAKGTILTRYCVGFEQHGLYADGYGGTYSNFIAMNSPACGYAGESSGTTHPAAGTILGQYCDGSTQIQTKANGSGGSYEDRVTNSSACQANVVYPANGTLMSTFCDGSNQMGRYADGRGGTYNAVVQVNSTQCGWVAPTVAPTRPPTTLPPYTPPPVTYPPAGIVLSSTCEGTTQVILKANGNGGVNEFRVVNSTQCGGGQPPPVTPPPPTYPAAGTVLSSGCEGTTQVILKATGNGGSTETRVVNSTQCGGGQPPPPTPGPTQGPPTPGPTQAPPAGTPTLTYEITTTVMSIGSWDANIVRLNGFRPNTPFTIEFWVQHPSIDNGQPRRTTTESGTTDAQGRGMVDRSSTLAIPLNGTHISWVREVNTGVVSPKLNKLYSEKAKLTIQSNKGFVRTGDTFRITLSLTNGTPSNTYQVAVYERSSSFGSRVKQMRSITANISGSGSDYFDVYYDGSTMYSGAVFMWGEISVDNIRSAETTVSFNSSGPVFGGTDPTAPPPTAPPPFTPNRAIKYTITNGNIGAGTYDENLAYATGYILGERITIDFYVQTPQINNGQPHKTTSVSGFTEGIYGSPPGGSFVADKGGVYPGGILSGQCQVWAHDPINNIKSPVYTKNYV